MPAIPIPPPRPFSDALWLPWPQIFSETLRFRLESLDRIQTAVGQHIAQERRDIRRRWSEIQAASTIEGDVEQMYGDSLSNDDWELDEMARDFALLHCVSQYHGLENALMAVFGSRYAAAPKMDREQLLRRVVSVKVWKSSGIIHPCVIPC